MTAYALVERGITRHLSEMKMEGRGRLGIVRHIRKEKVLKHIKNVLGIYPEKLVDFMSALPKRKKFYDAIRFSKENIKKIEDLFSDLLDNQKAEQDKGNKLIKQLNLKEVNAAVEEFFTKAYEKNALAMCQ